MNDMKLKDLHIMWNKDTQDKITRWMFIWPGTAGTVIHFTYGSGVESIPNVACRTKAMLANHSRISPVGRAFGNSRLVLALPASHVPMIGRSIRFYLYPSAAHAEMKRPHEATRRILNFAL